MHGYQDVVCGVCRFAQPLANRQDVQQMAQGGGMPLQHQQQPHNGQHQGWGGGGPPGGGEPPKQQGQMHYG